MPQTDTPIISLHTSTDGYGRGGGHLGGGLEQQGRQVKTSMALSSVLSWKQAFCWDLSEQLFKLFSHPISSLHRIPVSLPFWLFSGYIVFTSPVCDGLAPIYSCNLLICEEGPVIREVPESTMASQPCEQNATRPWIFMLQMKNKASLSKRHIHCDWRSILLLAKVPEYGLKLKLAAKLSQP